MKSRQQATEILPFKDRGRNRRYRFRIIETTNIHLTNYLYPITTKNKFCLMAHFCTVIMVIKSFCELITIHIKPRIYEKKALFALCSLLYLPALLL